MADEYAVPTLEAALLFIANHCDGANSTDGIGFNRHDALFGQVMAEKVRAGNLLYDQDYVDVYKMLKTYNNNQLAPNNLDLRLIPKTRPSNEAPKDNHPQEVPPSPELIAKARETLEHGDPIGAHLNHVTGRVYGGKKPARAILLSGYSAYLNPEDRFHTDAVGSAQSGKTATTTAVLESFPPKNVIILSEVSPKALYYLTQKNPERLKDSMVYIDDERPEHIPVLKTFRNEENVTPCNMTVSDGEVLELIVKYRPAVLGSSVIPLRDLEKQATSRTFMISIPDATPDEEKKIREAIRLHSRAGAILRKKDDEQLMILRTMATILRDEGLREILIPFDVIEPTGADRRGTGQFMRLIKVSAFINQYQRPILELKDGRKFVLATYADLETAAEIWFDFAEGQEFKISPKVIDVLKALSDARPGTTAPALTKVMGTGQRTIERYLEDLYESGIACREHIAAPGRPWGYWCEKELRQEVMSQISDTGDVKTNSDSILTKSLCRKYLGDKSSDSLKDSIKQFFSNNDIINKEMYNGIKKEGVFLEGSPEEIYLSLFSSKSCRNSENVADDSEYSRQDEMSQLLQISTDNDLENVADDA